MNYQEYLASREWALKREAVRERSRNTCERCFSNPQDAVHHKTYERIGDEKLEDLIAVCNPCHEFLSAKSKIDPVTDGIGVYLAGKILCGVNQSTGDGIDWRDELFIKDEDNWLPYDVFDSSGEHSEFPVLENVLKGGFDCTGPYYVEDGDHGRCVAAYAQPHVIPSLSHQTTQNLCLDAINRSSCVFAWIDSPDAYGTLVELGFANAREIPVFTYFSELELYTHMWFISELAWNRDPKQIFKSVSEAWDAFTKLVTSEFCIRQLKRDWEFRNAVAQ